MCIHIRLKTINWKKNKESILEGIDNLVKGKLLSDKKISEKSLTPWKSVILTKVEKNVSKLKTRIKLCKIILKEIDIIICLEVLQNKFFLLLLMKHPTMLLLHLNGIMLK